MESHKFVIIFVAMMLFLLCLSDATASPISESLKKRLESRSDTEQVSVIVSLQSKPDISKFVTYRRKNKRKLTIKALKENASTSQKGIRLLLNKKKITSITSLWATNSLAFEAPVSVIRQLESFPGIAEIRYDQQIELPQEPAFLYSNPQSNLNMINAPAMWDAGFTGAGVVVAILDSGVDFLHPDLSGSWRGGANSWFDPHNQSMQPYDVSGHGTQVAGIITAADNGGTIIGCSYGAQWIAAKIFDDSGHAPFSKIHECFQWLLDPDGNSETDDLPDVVNNSWGLVDFPNQCVMEFQDDIDLLRAMDMVVVFSAGNSGPNASTSISPANNQNVLSVGGVLSNNLIANFSSRGPSPCNSNIFPSIVAPSVNIKTTDLTSGGLFPQSYVYASGTSIAAPHVSAAAVLLRQAFPDANSVLIEQALTLSAEDLGSAGADYDYGFGLVDVFAAYEFLRAELCNADTDLDGSITLADIYAIAEQWLIYPCLDCPGDLNLDQNVNMLDFAEFSNQYSTPGCH